MENSFGSKGRGGVKRRPKPLHAELNIDTRVPGNYVISRRQQTHIEFEYYGLEKSLIENIQNVEFFLNLGRKLAFPTSYTS